FRERRMTMRTRETGLARGLKNLAILMILTAMTVSCGKNNTTGKDNDSSTIGWNGFGTGPYTGSNGNTLPANWMDIVGQENPCYQGGQRAPAQMPINATVNVGALYVGVTSEGDIAVVQNQGGAPTMNLYICPRPGLTGQGQLYDNIVLEHSNECPVSQITKTNVALEAQYGPFYLKFAPIHIPGTNRMSQLCSSNYY
ncbi:MAG: hypothetical protein WEB87_01745, partial [Bacteriovoracaceae bacterium]